MSRKRKKNKNNSLLVINKPVKFTYTHRLEQLLIDIGDNISYAIMGSYLSENKYGYKLLDISKVRNKFRLFLSHDDIIDLDIKDFINNFFNYKFSIKEINKFISSYNRALKLKDNEFVNHKMIDTTPFDDNINFIYNPKDVLYTFSSLCYYTYPHGYESMILRYILLDLQKDEHGNYYYKVGESDTMFTCHLDSACRNFTKVKLMSFEKNGYEFISSDGRTILSADDKAGVTVLLYMIAHNIPGLYYFFLGEEVGGIGSGLLSRNFSSSSHLNGINKCISFDRRNYYSIITHQGGSRTCSDKFADSLSDEFYKYGLSLDKDDTGIFTDSANFTNHISECTNISVGYFNEHTTNEHQNITFLKKLCEVCVKIDWENLSVERDIEDDIDLYFKHYDLIKEFNTLSLNSQKRIQFYTDRIFFQLKIEGHTSFDSNYYDIITISNLFDKYNKNPYIYYMDDNEGKMYLNIEIE